MATFVGWGGKNIYFCHKDIEKDTIFLTSVTLPRHFRDTSSSRGEIRKIRRLLIIPKYFFKSSCCVLSIANLFNSNSSYFVMYFATWKINFNSKILKNYMRILRKFWPNAGPTFQHLKLSQSSFIGFPNLQALSCRFESQSLTRSQAFQLQSNLESGPNVKTFLFANFIGTWKHMKLSDNFSAVFV